VEGPGGAAVDYRSFATPYVIVGSDPQSDLVLEHEEVSARHVYLQRIGGRLYCVDLVSQGGPARGGSARRAGWLEPSQTLRIGPYRIRTDSSEEDGDGSSPTPNFDDDFNLPALTLTLSHQGFKVSECPIAGGLSLVGSSTDCDVRLLDPGVSSVHCSLLYTRMGLWVVDVLGKGGIEVNGTPVRHALLSEGDEVYFGRSAIRAPRVENMPAEPGPGEQRRTEMRSSSDSTRRAALHAPIFEPAHRDDPEIRPPVYSSYERMRRRHLEDEALERLSAKERRASCRYPVSEACAVLSWWEPRELPAVIVSELKTDPTSSSVNTIYARIMTRWSESHNGTPSARAAAELARDPLRPIEETMKACSSPARLVNISQTGVLVLSESVPPADAQVWLRLETPQPSDWIEVVIKGAIPADAGMYRVRLAFREACPYDLFKALVYTNQQPGA
jgi:pSer/pThr/pTyr-binding forkhead associated (FHA) protein